MAPDPLAAPLRARIEAALQEFVDREAGRLAELAPELAALADSARDYLLAGGKRLRPLFCYWGFHAVPERAPSDSEEPLLRAAAALELVQACALAHDDVIDASDSRRGRPSLHREWQQRHEAAGWSGTSERFGVATGILLGDLFLAWSDEMLATSGLTPAQMQRARGVWDAMRAEVLAGQFLDVVEQVRAESSIDRSLRIAELKSARYSVERPLLMGAAIAAAPVGLSDALRRFGRSIGVAFQLRDDLLGVFGDPELTGKPAGDDLREGKRTVLIAWAMANATVAQRSVLLAGLGSPDLTETDVSELRGLLRAIGAVDTVEAMIRQRSEQALRDLEEATVTAYARDGLLALADLAVQRQN